MLFFLKFLSIIYPAFWINGYKIIANRTLYSISIKTIFVKYKNSLSNFNITEFTYRNNSNAHVVNNKMAPGSSGTFKISVPVKSCIIRSCVGSECPKISSFSKS